MAYNEYADSGKRKGELMWKIKAINADQAVCDLCGKEHLKRVVWLENEEGEVIATGTVCASKLLKISVKVQKKNESDFVYAQMSAREKELKVFIDTLPPTPHTLWLRNEEAYQEMDKLKLDFTDRKAWIANDHRIQALEEWYATNAKAIADKRHELNKKYGIAH